MTQGERNKTRKIGSCFNSDMKISGTAQLSKSAAKMWCSVGHWSWWLSILAIRRLLKSFCLFLVFKHGLFPVTRPMKLIDVFETVDSCHNSPQWWKQKETHWWNCNWNFHITGETAANGVLLLPFIEVSLKYFLYFWACACSMTRHLFGKSL